MQKTKEEKKQRMKSTKMEIDHEDIEPLEE